MVAEKPVSTKCETSILVATATAEWVAAAMATAELVVVAATMCAATVVLVAVATAVAEWARTQSQ